MTNWIVSGTWKIDSKPGRLTVQAASMREAFADADAQGLSPLEAMQGAAARQVTPLRSKRLRCLGLSNGEAWAVGIVGLFLAPIGVGFALLIWAVLAHRQLREVT